MTPGNLLPWEISEAIPAEHAFNADHESVTVRLDRSQEIIRLGPHITMQPLVPFAIEDAQIHLPCVQIDAAIEFVLLIVESHHGLLGELLLSL